MDFPGYNDCSIIYVLTKGTLRPVKPPCCPNVTGNRIIDILIIEKKNKVFLSFSVIGGNLQLLIATTTFGIGTDCPDMSRIVYCSFPITPKEYVKQTGSMVMIHDHHLRWERRKAC